MPPSISSRDQSPMDAATPQATPPTTHTRQAQASLVGPPGLSTREHTAGQAGRSAAAARRPSPYANGHMSTPAGDPASLATGWRMPRLSPPGAKSYPIALNAQIAGFALVNVASSGPARPTTAQERVELARQQAAQATRAADAADQPDVAPAVRKKRNVLQRAGRLFSKAGATVRTKVLGIGERSAPTVKDVLQVGRPRQEGPPPTSVQQERQIEQQRIVVDEVRTTYHARAGRAALAAVEALHAREEQGSEDLVDTYVARFVTLNEAPPRRARGLAGGLHPA
jgi:hypothetical protein